MKHSHATSLQTYRDLQAWQKCFLLAVDCYRLARSEIFLRRDLTDSMLRAVVSALSQLAGASGTLGTQHYVEGLSEANAALVELECILLVLEAANPGEKISILLEHCAETAELTRELQHAMRAWAA